MSRSKMFLQGCRREDRLPARLSGSDRRHQQTEGAVNSRAEIKPEI